MTLALVEDVNFLPKCSGAPNGGDTGSGIQDDLELTQTSQLPALTQVLIPLWQIPIRIVGVFVENIPMIKIIDSHLGDLRPKTPAIDIVDDLLLFHHTN